MAGASLVVIMIPGYCIILTDEEIVRISMDDDFPFSAGFTKQDGTAVKAGEVGRKGIETMQYWVKGVISDFPVK